MGGFMMRSSNASLWLVPAALLCSIFACAPGTESQNNETDEEESCTGPGQEYIGYAPDVEDGFVKTLRLLEISPVKGGNYTIDSHGLRNESAIETYDLGEKDRLLLATIYIKVCRSDSICIKEILSGAHVNVTKDSAEIYNFIKNEVPGAYPRNSSHDSQDNQFGVRLGETLQTILTGTTKDGSTWFQFEGSPWDPWNFNELWGNARHCVDFLKYKITGKNVGPLGLSEHNDANPLKLPLSN